MKKILCLLTVSILSIDPSFCTLPNGIDNASNDAGNIKRIVGTTPRDIDLILYDSKDFSISEKVLIKKGQELDLIIEDEENKNIKLLHSCKDRLSYSKNLHDYSTRAPTQLQEEFSEKYGNIPIRVITAENIFSGVGENCEYASSIIEDFKRLFTNKDTTKLEEKFNSLIDCSYFVEDYSNLALDDCWENTSDGKYTYHLPYKLIDEDSKNNCATRSKKMLKQTLKCDYNYNSILTFLLAHNLVLPNAGIVMGYAEKDESPSMLYPHLKITEETSKKYTMLPKNINGEIAYTYSDFDIFEYALSHELNHATHDILGITPRDKFSVFKEYSENQFLKELLFNGLKNISNSVKDIMMNKIKDLNGDELKQFESNGKEAFNKGIMFSDYVGVFGEFSKDMLTNKEDFISDLADRLAFLTATSLWDNSPEEISNMIGVIYDNGTLYINALSDMDTAIALDKDVFFPHLGVKDDINITDRVELRSEGKVPSKEEFVKWFADFISQARYSNLPTRESWEMLVKLHQGAHDLGTEN